MHFEPPVVTLALLFVHLQCTASGELHPLGRVGASSQLSIEEFSGRHVVLMGDSVTRYQYLSLVYFLEYGAFPGNDNTWIAEPGGAEIATPVWEKNFGSWEEFFNLTNGHLRGHEVCDCYRAEDIPPASATENRYYHNPALNISVSFIGWMGAHHALKGHYVPGQLGPAGALAAREPEKAYEAMGCRTPFCAAPFRWKARHAWEAIEEHVSKLHPTDFIANAGLWPVAESFEWGKLASAGAELRAKTGCNLFWKTTTPQLKRHRGGCASMEYRKHAQMAEMADNGWHVFDAFRIVCNITAGSSIFVDRKHFKGGVYAELNRELFRHIDLAMHGKPVVYLGAPALGMKSSSGGEGIEESTQQVPQHPYPHVRHPRPFRHVSRLAIRQARYQKHWQRSIDSQ